MPPEVSAIITTHGRPHHVGEAIASIRREVHGDVELIVVNDGDGPIPFGDGVRTVSGQHLGVGRARNLGLAAARGQFVIFLDDDDVAFPWRISTLIEAAQRSGSDLCFGMTRRVVVESGLVLEDVPTGLSSLGPVEFRDILACAPHINAVLVRSSVLREVGGFDFEAQHFDDWSAWLRIADRGARMGRVGETVAEWRVHTSGLSGLVAGRGQMKAHILALFDRLIPRLSSANADAVRTARHAVAERVILTYDDYADAMGQLRGPAESAMALT